MPKIWERLLLAMILGVIIGRSSACDLAFSHMGIVEIVVMKEVPVPVFPQMPPPPWRVMPEKKPEAIEI